MPSEKSEQFTRDFLRHVAPPSHHAFPLEIFARKSACGNAKLKSISI